MGKDFLGELGALAERAEQVVADLDVTLVNLVSRLGPWLAPLPTAYLTATATVRHLHWPVSIGVVAGAVAEILALATSDTALRLRAYNQTRRKSDPEAPFALAVGLAGIYFGAVTLLTVALDTLPDLAMFAPLVFPILGLAGVTVLALRADHSRRLMAIEAGRSRRRSGGRSGSGQATGQGAGQVAGQVAGQGGTVGRAAAGSLERANRQRRLNREEALEALVAFFAENPTASYRVAGLSVGRSKSWVTGAIGDLEKEGRLQRNGGGVEVVG